MKKLLSAVVCAAALVSVADTEVSLGSVGVISVTSSYKNTIIATAFKDMASENNIAVSNIVKTTNLTAGDTLYTVDNGNYECWTLTADPNTSGALYWAKTEKVFTLGSDGLSEASGLSASAVTSAIGQGLWLVRKDVPSGSFTFQLYGKPASGTSTVTAGTTVLLGNPTSTDKYPTLTNAVGGDKIHVPQGTTFNRVYTYTGSLWRYTGSDGKKVTQDDPPTIPAGTGFWYQSAGKDDVTVAW